MKIMKMKVPELEYFLCVFPLQKGVLISSIMTSIIWTTLLLLYIPYSLYLSPARDIYSPSSNDGTHTNLTTHIITTPNQLDWSTIDRMLIISIVFLLFLDSLLVCGVNRKYRPEPDLLIPWLSIYFLLIPAEMILAVGIIIHHPHLVSALLFLPPVPYSYLWVAVNSYRVQVVRTQEAVKKLVFQSRGQMNPSQKLFRKAFETEFKSTYDLASEVVDIFCDDKRCSSQPDLSSGHRHSAKSPKHDGQRKGGSHMDLSRKQRSPSNNSVFDLLQMELENLKHGSYKPELYETKSTWSNSISNSPSVSPLNISPAITPILLSPAMSTKQMSIGSSSPSSSTRSLSSLGSKRRNYPYISEAQPQNQNFLTPHFVPKLKGCKSKENIRTKEEVFSSDQKSQSLGCLEMVERNDDKQIGAMKQID